MLYYLSSILFLLLSVLMFYLGIFFLLNKYNFMMEWMCLSLNSFEINMLIYLDWISLLFVFTVMIISSMIMMYCSEYMSHDNYSIRFFYLVFLFIMSMLLMILSPNMISILLGWDGLGLVSYCLVIYYQSFSSYNSGMLTVLMNRIGDVFILLSISMMFIFGFWNFMMLNNSFMMMLLFVIIAGFTKSAQFPFSSWLPAAMAAPTPVSSLVHSSTLVTAGVYLLIRFNYILYSNENLLLYILMTGLFTMTFAGMSANFEFDVKKIIAYSTLSQLGLMMMILAMKWWELAYFHLVIHAMFKSMMFMCSGVIIHSMLNYQDIRFMGKVKNYLPLTSLIFMLSNFSLCGMPFMSGFYSKDKILETMFFENFSLYFYFILMFASGLTVSYSFRLMYYLMNNNFKFVPLMKINDFKFMNYPMLILLIMSMMFGEIMNWVLFNNIESIFLLFMEKISILILCIMFFYFGLMNYKMKSIMKNNFFMSFFFGKMWFLYNLNKIIIMNPLMFSKLYYKIYDKGYSEFNLKNSVYLYSDKIKFMNLLSMNYLISYILLLSYMILLFFIF